jgi:hypothetical protein
MKWLGGFVSTLVLLLCLVQQGCDNSPTKPVERETNLISNGSFELDGEPSLDGWTVVSPTGGVTLVNEAAPNGGEYSLQMSSGGLMAAPSRLTVAVCEAQTGEVYRLSAYLRGESGVPQPGGRIGLSVGPDLGTGGIEVYCRDTAWTRVSLTLTVGENPQDSVRVWLMSFPGGCTNFGKGFYDLVTLERVEETVQ